MYETDYLDEILKKEIEFISLYGKIIDNNGTLCNLTNGGDGSLGLKHTEETKNKISIKRKNNPKYTERLKSKEFITQRIKSLKINGYVGSMNGKTHSEATILLMKSQRAGGNNVNAKKVLNTNTGEIYKCVGDAADKEGINKQILYKYLKGSRVNKSNLVYYYE